MLIFTAGEGCEFVYGDCDTWAYSCPVLGATGCSYDYQAVVCIMCDQACKNQLCEHKLH